VVLLTHISAIAEGALPIFGVTSAARGAMRDFG
jgi:hypothetical protein